METHLDRKRVLGFRQVVTEHAVERREHRRAFRTGRTFPKNAPELPESQVERAVYERGYPADAAVHGSAEQPRRCAADGAVDRLDEIGYALRASTTSLPTPRRSSTCFRPRSDTGWT